MKGQGHRHFSHKFWIIPSRQHIINAPTFCYSGVELEMYSKWDIMKQLPREGSTLNFQCGLYMHMIGCGPASPGDVL